MKRAPISILKAQLSQYLGAVKSGEEVIVTEHGRPIARISPIAGVDTLDDRMARLIREGRVRPPTGKRPIVLPRIDELPQDPEGKSLEWVLEERREGR
jgi:prevent-host-death family protein